MEWSYGKNRVASALERLLEPKKKVRWRWYYFCCCCKYDAVENISQPATTGEIH
jgi:hypothetical protein